MLTCFISLYISDKKMKKQESNSTLQKTADTFGEVTLIKHPQSAFEQHSQPSTIPLFSERQDEYRSPFAHKDGGFVCKDQKQVDKLRSVGKEMIKLIGRKILSGELNLTKISFPIRACAPKTALQNSVESCVIFPHYMSLAANCTDPLERFKLTCTAIISSTSYIDLFLKPLNPIIGQTLQGSLKDGTKLYCQQVSHHPPISYFLVYGPEQCYRFSGYYNFDVSPGLNSLSLKNKGHRKFQFKDGTEIVASYATGIFNNTFLGTSRVEQTGECLIQDKKNGYKVKIQYGKMKKKSSDYFKSFIERDGKNLEEIFGTYCGFIEISKKRYWDMRDFQQFQISYKDISQPILKSSFLQRQDLQLLMSEKMEEAQKAKQMLQHIQRTDEKMRKKYRKQLH